MALLTWNDSFSVGVKALDDQHKRLMQAMNDLHAAMLGGKARDITAPLLQSLLKYTQEHFTAEEAMMSRANYPNLQEHRARHHDLSEQVKRYVSRLERGEISLSVHLLNFLRDWLTTHIQKEDRQYGPWMQQQGMR